MKSATFTISSLGKLEEGFTPIINPPEVFFLAFREQNKFVLENSNVIEKEIMPFQFHDHRVINGADAGKFTYYIKEFLENIMIDILRYLFLLAVFL